MQATGVRQDNAKADLADTGVSRRAVLAGFVTVASARKAGADPDPYRQVEMAMEALVASMRAIHGGEWSMRINHEQGYAQVSRDFS